VIPSAKVVAVLLSLHTCAREPHTPAYVARLTMVGESIAVVSDAPDDAAGLLSIWYYEGAGCEDVHAGTVKGGDGLGPWQIEPGSHRVPPFAGLSREATTHAAGEALWLWRHTRRCGSLERRFGAYAGLGCRSWSGAAKRANLFAWLLPRVSTT